MRRTVVTFILLMLVIALLPSSSAQFVSFTTNDEITLLRGDYSSGTLMLMNAGNFDLKVASYRGFRVRDSNGNEVPGFNLTVSSTVLSDWKSHKVLSLSYNISCSLNVTPGNYTLYLFFLAVTSDNSMYLAHAEVPLHVIVKALEFEDADTYVRERPGSSYVLNGETIVVFSHVHNVGHSNITVEATTSFFKGSRIYFFENKTLTMKPGDNLIRFEIPVGYDLPEGTYRLEYRVEYGDGGYRYSREIPVRFGVKLVGFSLQSDEVRLGEKNRAYLTLLSERNVGLNLTVETYRNERIISNITTPVAVNGGTDVIEAELPTNAPGNLTAVIKLTFDGRLIGIGNVSYRVNAPPVIRNVTYERVSDTEVLFKIVIENPNCGEVQGEFGYRIAADGNVLYKDSLQSRLTPGANEVSLKFELPAGKVVEYEFTLSAMGETSTSKGELYLQPPAPPTTTATTTTTTALNMTTTSSGTSRGLWAGLVIVVFLLLAAGAFYYTREGGGPRKRTRPRPKRRSPLGRFKRPKEPEFKENRELPKKR
ncbi:hypothetical protein [Thermococcus sp. 21S7]|uniref:hypothetical protein n=1 Tax=Thermococcus sp. 21S7 TaxID=1638221 RepID=UPI0014395031|nr:hypothetical protein [Thermococcus sp. 21S7]NJE62199.1 hypothetical protein [Thermococcus sp. 21S7]